jgi:hypothetical protein
LEFLFLQQQQLLERFQQFATVSLTGIRLSVIFLISGCGKAGMLHHGKRNPHPSWP